MQLHTGRGLLIMLATAAVIFGLAAVALTQPGADGGGRAKGPQPGLEPGGFKHTNRLADATSPYLLQHAHNPVDWYPWGPEALERAKKEDKPIFLSVGYSTCYWCHVMEREVFENEAIAALMNERFVCIKVDREERPDLDQIYMLATQLMTQHGGWPNSVFMTPELKPFFTGTYFGAEDLPGRPGFGTVITQLGDAWATQRDKVNQVADQVGVTIKDVLGERLASIPKVPLEAAIVDSAAEQIASSYDARDGGFGLAPKFPSDFYYSFLLDLHKRRVAAGDKDGATLSMVVTSLDAMAAGGIHDHVGGGFHRYATDAQWKVPHFEKMLYNQAQLAVAYLDAFAVTGEARDADTARGIFRFVGGVFTGPDGQFYSALDAETDAVEGAYYTWTREQIAEVLGKDDAAKFLDRYELAEVPIFPGHKHPEGGTLVSKVRGEGNPAEITAMLGKLAAARGARKLPRLDDKAIAAWNGMMIDAYARGAEVLHDDAYRAAGARAAGFVLERMMTPDGRLLRSVRPRAAANGAAHAPQEGFLEDYAFVIRGLLAMHRVETDPDVKARWLGNARALQAKADELFWDKDAGGYFFATPQPDLIARGKDIGDNATPGGNSVMAHDLIDLFKATGDAAYRTRAEEVLRAFSGTMAQSPRGSVYMVHALERLLAIDAGAGPPESPAPPPLEIRAPPPGAAAAAGFADSSAHVRVAAAVEPVSAAPGGIITVTATLTIDDGWHINANPASADFLIATVVDVQAIGPPDTSAPRAAPSIEVIKITYPTPTRLDAGGAGGDAVDVYSGTARVTVQIRLPKDSRPGASTPLRVMVKYQACSDAGVCLMPADWAGQVNVTIAAP